MNTYEDKFDLIQSPFARLRTLLDGAQPGLDPVIDLTIGEPRHSMPTCVSSIIQKHNQSFANYPPSSGTPSLRVSIATWLKKRYSALQALKALDELILPLNGSREGLFSAQFLAVNRKRNSQKPIVLIPNPFYQCYVSGALAAGADPVFMSVSSDTNYLPDLDSLDEGLLSRTAALFICSPSNPEGAVATQEYIEQAIQLARRYDFMLFSDECYSEVYFETPPTGALETAWQINQSFNNVVVFNSLSKRSNLPGLRSGFVAGDKGFIEDFARFRNVACPQVPLPIQHVSEAVWAEESHVIASRELYREKFLIAEACLKPFTEFKIPAAGFFIWLNISDFGCGETVTERIWKDSGVKILPGAYLAQQDETGFNPGLNYVRLALVHDLETTREAFKRISNVLSS